MKPKYIARLLNVTSALKKKSVLLLGPRRTGKSSLIRHELPTHTAYNLLASDTFAKLCARPSLIRESITVKTKLIVIDEIQKLPSLMDEVHLMIEEKNIKFLLTGSSARKLRRTHTSLMAGRAQTMFLQPFVFGEIENFSLERRLLFGSLPPVWLSDEPWTELESYSSDYLKFEIQSEAFSRRLEAFSRFLITAAINNTKILNFESIASDAQVPARTIREYYSVLSDTLMGVQLEPIDLKITRKAVSHAKFYFFDTGVANALIHQKSIAQNTDAYGVAFEHFIFQELYTYKCYERALETLHFWAIHGGAEVDFILNGEIAVEVKSSVCVSEKHLKSLKVLDKLKKMKRLIIVSRDVHPRKIGKIEIYPYAEFLKKLWAGKITG